MSTPQACRMARVTARQVDHWIRRRALPLRQHGIGVDHRWSIADVAQLSVIGACASAGLDLERSFSAGWAARRALDDGHDQTCVLLAPSTPPLYLASIEQVPAAVANSPAPLITVIALPVILDRIFAHT
jgi:hypothetical protein